MESYFFDDQGVAYGPFPVRDDGYPEPGPVMRYFRKQNKIRGCTVAKELGCTNQWISRMEIHNKMPEDINRRGAIARIAGIPLSFLGLSSAPRSAPEPILPIDKDISIPKTMLPMLWQNFQAGANLADLKPSLASMMNVLYGARDVASLVLKAKYLRLYSLTLRDQRQMATAAETIEQAIKIGQELNNHDLLAVGYLTRGRIAVEDDKPQEAIPFFEQALLHELVIPSSVRGTTLIEIAMARAQIVRSATDRDQVKQLVNDAGEIAFLKPSEDGSFTTINPGLFLGYQSLTAMYTGDYIQAGIALNQADELLPASQERRRAKINIMKARHAAFGLGDLDQSLMYLTKGYTVSKQLGSRYNLHTIQQLNTELLVSKWSGTPNVKNLQVLLG
jgi:tetratricopeptide (TPR) repeat protein